MQSYEDHEITNVINAPWSIAGISEDRISDSGVLYAKLPSITTRYYTPVTHVKWKYPPLYDMPFSMVKRLRLIKMTDYSIGEAHTYNHLLRHPRKTWDTYYDAFVDCEATGATSSSTGIVTATTEYNDVIDGATFIADNDHISFNEASIDELIATAVNEVKSDAVSSLTSGFDLLTEMAEFPETLGMILAALRSARRPLQGIKELIDTYKKARARGKSHRQANDDIMSQWMQYRYGIMPLVYSIQDAIKLLDEFVAEFHTERAFQNHVINVDSRPIIRPESYLYQTINGNVKVSAVGKAKYERAGLRLADLITINPFLTAWELVPLSFVIDWFVNVGDVIFSHTSTLVDLALDRKYCYSIKRELDITTWYHTSYIDEYHRSIPPYPLDNTVYCAPKGSIVPEQEIIYRHVHKSDQKCWTKVLSSYERVLFEPTDIEFQFAPSLGWMRQMDSYALSFNKISKQLKKLK